MKLFGNLKYDFPASVVVFLVALPLCLGVAVASGAPPMAGILAGVVGGLVVGVISRSHVSVSGPAAGLTTVVLAAITEMGSFQIFLLAVVVAGVIQLILGFLRGGFIANYIPSSVISGLLASIGIILILKQIPHAIGYDSVPEEDFSFNQADHENTFSELWHATHYISFGAVIITLLSILVLIYWEKIVPKKMQLVPASLVVVFLGVGLNATFYHLIPNLYIGREHLVNLPPFDSFGAVFTFPSFKSITNSHVLLVGFQLAVIASLETLLNLEAVQKIDPHKRKASPNQELVAQGVGNIVSGLIGGIPVTSVIVRSSVNINAGGRTKLTTIIHGVFLFLSILFLAPLLNLIPLSALAAILILTGYKLAKVDLFIEKYKKGWNQFIPFVITIVAIISTDLLIGVVIGLVVSILFLLRSNYQNPLKIKKERVNVKEIITIQLPNQLSFINKVAIKKALWKLPHRSNVIIDARHNDYIDNDVLEIIETFKNTIAVEHHIHLNIIGLRDKYDIEDQVEFVDTVDKSMQQKLKPSQVLRILKEGNARFVAGTTTNKFYDQQISVTAEAQNPLAVVITCIDSRTSPEIIFDRGLGDLISIRIAGNIINDDIVGSVEFACRELGTKLVVVLGHSSCGAVNYAVKSLGFDNFVSITDKIQMAVDSCQFSRDEIMNDSDKMNKVIVANTKVSIDNLLQKSEYLNEKVKEEKIQILSAFYETNTGLITFE